IKMREVDKWFDDFNVLKKISLDIYKQEKVILCGPSGSGKSTLIRLINGLEEHQKGEIFVNDVELNGLIKNVREIRNDVGMVFQHFNLFPHLTVLENCTLAPVRVKNIPKSEAKEMAMEYLRKVKIPDQANKYPGRLSGGQQQR